MADVGGVKSRTVADIMSHPVVTAGPDETIADVGARMEKLHVGSVVVVDGSRAIGILTERDMVRLAAAGADASVAKVTEWMTANPDTVDPSEEVADAFESLASRGYRHIPVVSGDKLVGVVSMRDLMKIARIRPVHVAPFEAPKGLEGVVVAETEIGDVRGTEGFYHYRQYNAVDLAEQRSLEDVWHLLYQGELPTAKQREAFMDEIRPLREIPPGVVSSLPAVARTGSNFQPLTALRSAYSLLAADLDMKSWMDIDPATLRAQAMQTCAVIPTLLMALYRISQGLEPVAPHPDLPYAANYLYMLNGVEPDPDHARAIEHYLISTVDHGFNASTFTARVITSTGADIGSAVVGAIGALSGPLHGGAPSRALDMLDAIGTPDRADEWIRNAITSGERLMGFGHRVYKTDDPRSLMLRRAAERLGGPKVEFVKYVEKRAVELLAELKPGRELYTNVEFFAGVVMDTIGVPRVMFTPTFASSRVIGWTSHVLEQAADNRLIRPAAHYVGPPPPQPLPPAN